MNTRSAAGSATKQFFLLEKFYPLLKKGKYLGSTLKISSQGFKEWLLIKQLSAY